MPFLEITTVGEVAFSNDMKLGEGYRYDIPFDNLMLPYIPIADILREQGLITEDVKVGFAHPDGYRGISLMANELLMKRPDLGLYIKRYFTNERVIEGEGERIRSIQAGQRFCATMLFPAEQTEELKQKINGRKRIGITSEGITGEVDLRIVDPVPMKSIQHEMMKLARYVALEYSVTLVTPTCFYAPYDEGDKTYLYVPGAVVSDYLHTYLKNANLEDWEGLRCTNAYISTGRKRFLPVPACDSVVKLDKQQLRYRLAPGKDPKRVEQDVGLSSCFSPNFENNMLFYTTPLTEHIVTRNGELRDALSAGQTFCGRIYGSDEMIRKCASFLFDNQCTFLGDLSEEGYGEAIFRIMSLHEAEIPTEIPVKSFDVSCASDVLLLNDEGMPSCKAEDLLREIEYVLNCPGRLMIEGRYTNIYRDYRRNSRWGTDDAVVRCMEKGSVLRVRTKDGQPVDVFPLRDCFLGERTEDGYGELYVYSARGQYYRLAQNMQPALYERNTVLTLREIEMGALFAHEVISSILKSRVRALAYADREERQNGVSIEELMPKELIFMMREHYVPAISDETLFRWYQDALEGREDA